MRSMYRRPKFLEVLIKIREEMARESDYDTDLFAEIVRAGTRKGKVVSHSVSDIEQNGSRPDHRSRNKD